VESTVHTNPRERIVEEHAELQQTANKAKEQNCCIALSKLITRYGQSSRITYMYPKKTKRNQVQKTQTSDV
jgi:hypothetical protein